MDTLETVMKAVAIMDAFDQMSPLSQVEIVATGIAMLEAIKKGEAVELATELQEQLAQS